MLQDTLFKACCEALPQLTEDEKEDGDVKRTILPPFQDSINLCCQDPQNLTWGLSEVGSKETPRQDIPAALGPTILC